MLVFQSSWKQGLALIKFKHKIKSLGGGVFPAPCLANGSGRVITLLALNVGEALFLAVS